MSHRPNHQRLPTPAACVIAWLALSIVGWAIIAAFVYFIYCAYCVIAG